MLLETFCVFQTLLLLYFIYQTYLKKKENTQDNIFLKNTNLYDKKFVPDYALTRQFKEFDLLNLIPIPAFIIEFTNDERKLALVWGNNESIKFWSRKDFNDLLAIDFSEISEQALLHLRFPFEHYSSGNLEFVRDMFLIYPGGKPKNILYYYAPVTLPSGKLGILLTVIDVLQNLPPEELQMFDISKKYLNSHVSLYDLKGDLLTRNNNAKMRFLSTKPTLEEHFQSGLYSSLIIEKVQKAQYGEKIFEKEIMYKKGSSYLVFLSETFCIRNPVTGDKAIFINETDVTKISNMSTYIAKIGHDIKTPLNGIMGMLQCLTLKNLPEDASQCIGMALSSSKSLVELLNDIIDISKLQSGAFTLNNQLTTPRLLCQMLEEIANTFYFKLNQNVELFIDFPMDINRLPKEFLIDSLRIKQIITNFTTNAIKFTENGTITIGVKFQNQKIRFYCKDTGIGVPKDKQELIFDEFKQSSNDHSSIGTGLGLSIVKSLTQLMGGNLGVESIENQGSTFYVDIPVKLEYRDFKMKKDTTVLILGECNLYKNYLKELLSDVCQVELKLYHEITNETKQNCIVIDNVKDSNVHYISKFMNHFKNSKVIPIIDPNESLQNILNVLKTKVYLSKPLSPVSLYNLLFNDNIIREEIQNEQIKNEWKKDSGSLLLYEPNPKNSEKLLSILFSKIIKIEKKDQILDLISSNQFNYVFLVDIFENCLEITKLLHESKKVVRDFKIIVSPIDDISGKDKIKALKMGADEFFKFPFIYENLATIIGKWSKLNHLRIPDLIQGYKILIIDDNKINRIVLEKMILSFGENQISVSETGYQALEMVKKNSYSLIFLDINLPDISGRDLVHLIRKETEKFVPVIAFTGDSQNVEEFDDVIYKPTKLNDLQNMLLKWIIFEENISQKLTDQYLKNVPTKISMDGIMLPDNYDIDHIYSEKDLQCLSLTTIPAQILSITDKKFKVHWANSASVKFWRKKDLQDLIENNQFGDASKQNLERFDRILSQFDSGRRDLASDLNLMYPGGVATHTQFTNAPIKILDKGNVIRAFFQTFYEKDNQLSSEDVRIFYFSKVYSSFYLSLYDEKGEQILTKNKSSKERFSGIKNLKSHIGEKMAEKLLNNLPNTDYGQKMMELDLNFNEWILHAQIYLLRDPITGKKGIFIQEHDVTRMRKISKFISTLGHEFRTPLNGIMGSLQHFSDVYPNDTKMIQQVLDQTNMLYQSLNNIIEISQIESGFTNMYNENVIIDSVISVIEKSLKKIEKYSFYVEMDLLNSENFINLDFDSFSKIISKLEDFLKKTKCEMDVHLDFIKGKEQSYLLFGILLYNYEYNTELSDDLFEDLLNYSNGSSDIDLNFIILNSLLKICEGDISIEKVKGGTQINIKIPTSQLIIEKKLKFNFEPILLVSNDTKFKDYLCKLLKTINLVCECKNYDDSLKGNYSLVIYDEPQLCFIEKNLHKNSVIFSKEKLNLPNEIEKPIAPSEFLVKLNENLNNFTPRKQKSIEKQYIFLIVEDNKINQNILKKFLQKNYNDCLIDIANNGQEGIDIVKTKKKYDIIFMDLNMPKKNGIEATKEIMEFDPDSKVLIVTANSTIEPKEMHNLGIKGIIFKPLVFGQLKEKCENLLI